MSREWAQQEWQVFQALEAFREPEAACQQLSVALLLPEWRASARCLLEWLGLAEWFPLVWLGQELLDPSAALAWSSLRLQRLE